MAFIVLVVFGLIGWFFWISYAATSAHKNSRVLSEELLRVKSELQALKQPAADLAAEPPSSETVTTQILCADEFAKKKLQLN
jgi:hypothetical protein